MAFLKEDNVFTHVIAIDFGTGASGYSIPLILNFLSYRYGIAPKITEPG